MAVVRSKNAADRLTVARPAATLPEPLYHPDGTGSRHFNLIRATQRSALAGNQVNRSTDHAAHWSVISPDLTGGPGRDPNYPFGTSRPLQRQRLIPIACLPELTTAVCGSRPTWGHFGPE